MTLKATENITIHKGDSLEFLKSLPDNSVDLVCTDPPYDTDIVDLSPGNLKGFKNSFENTHLQGMSNGYNEILYLTEYKRLMLKFHAFIFCSNKQILKLIQFAKENNYTSTILVWWKYNAAPLTSNKWKNDIEYCVHIKEQGVKFIGSNKVDKYPIQRSKSGYSTEKPLELVKKYINIGSKENDVILDPFMGSGTTGIAAMQLNRKFIGAEIEKKWFEVSKKRITESLDTIEDDW